MTKLPGFEDEAVELRKIGKAVGGEYGARLNAIASELDGGDA